MKTTKKIARGPITIICDEFFGLKDVSLSAQCDFLAKKSGLHTRTIHNFEKQTVMPRLDFFVVICPKGSDVQDIIKVYLGACKKIQKKKKK